MMTKRGNVRFLHLLIFNYCVLRPAKIFDIFIEIQIFIYFCGGMMVW